MGRAGAPRTYSLRAHLLVLVVGTLLPALIVAGFLARRVVADNRQSVEQQLLEAARDEAALVDSEFAGTIRALQGLAQSDRLSAGDVRGFYAQAQRLLRSQPIWSAVSLATPEGQQVVNTERPFGEPLPFVTDRESVQQVASQRMSAVGNLRVGRITQTPGFPVRVPVVRDDRVAYLASAWITSRRFAQVLTRRSLGDQWVLGVVDTNGVVVARSRDAERFVGRSSSSDFLQRAGSGDEGVFRGMSLDNVLVYSAFSRAPMSRWIVGVAVPASVVDAPFRQSVAALSALAILLISIGGAGTFLVSRRVSGGISQSAAAAEAIASGGGPELATSPVSEIQRLQDALGRSAALLATRQRERDEHLAQAEAARREAEAADRAKDQFLAMLGHELRNPLAPALTALELMKLKGDAPTTRERDVVERQIRHMARLVDDLLDVSRLRRGVIGVNHERVDVGEVVARAVEMTAPLFTEKHHRLDVDIAAGIAVDGDRVRLAQVVSNLLANAAKYTEPGGRVTLRGWQDDQTVLVECRDSGIGISADLVPRVFDLFVQGERGLDRREGGLGLGLALARTLVELHGGRIDVASDGPQRGSTFTVRLPAAAMALPRVVEPPTTNAVPGAGARVGRVLVVDDNADALEMMVAALREAGIDVFGAAAPSEALEVAASVTPEAVILDIGLPEMNGFDLARALRRNADGTPLRLIALTGYGQEQDMAAARGAGFDAFFVKPVDFRVLLAALGRDPVAP